MFIEIVDSGQTGFVPIYCLQASDVPTQNNLSLLNVSIYDKPLSIGPGGFVSSIGPCHANLDQGNDTGTVPCSRSLKTRTYTRYSKDQSNLSRQISNISLHAYEHDAYGTLNVTPCQSLSFSALDSEPIVQSDGGGCRRRVMGNYQRQFVGDISVLESEVVTLVDEHQSDNDWRLVRRGDGRQGYVPKHIIVQDKMF